MMRSKELKNRDKLDREISRRIQSLEAQVPPELDHRFLESLQELQPEKAALNTRVSRSPWFKGVLAAAATVLLAAVMIFFYVSYQQNDPSSDYVAEAQEVWLQETTVEGTPATTYVMNPKEADMTIVWVEKIKNKNLNTK